MEFEYSIFNIPNLQQLANKEFVVKEIVEPKRENFRRANRLATRMVIHEGGEKALPLINEMIKWRPDRIEPLINKGMALLQLEEPDINELESVLKELKKLKRNQLSCLHAKVNHAYWVWDLHPYTLESHTNALELFQSVLKESEEVSDAESLSLLCCLYSAKAIYRLLRSFPVENHRQLVNKGFQMLKIMASSDQLYYRLEFWLWLSEFQQLARNAYLRLREHINHFLSQLQKENGLEDCSILTCAYKALEIVESDKNGTLDGDLNMNEFNGRIGKSYYQCALGSERLDERQENLEKAIEHARKYLEEKVSRAGFVPDLCAKILLHLWAVKYYQRYKSRVEDYLDRDYGHSGLF